MAYTKQNFVDGQVLTADQLNHMEEGISEAFNSGGGGTGGGGTLPLLFSQTLTEATGSIVVNKDAAGNAITLSEWDVLLHVPGAFSDYETPFYIYVVPNDHQGFTGKFVSNDNSATNVIRYCTVGTNCTLELISKYSNSPSTQIVTMKYHTNGVATSKIECYTYNSGAKPFPVGTYVEVRGR